MNLNDLIVIVVICVNILCFGVIVSFKKGYFGVEFLNIFIIKNKFFWLRSC